MVNKNEFSNRWGIVLASLGMAVGAGNLWRFPRLAGQYGGTFIILWIFFLLVWSIPILLAEFSIGKQVKKSVIGSFAKITHPKFAWMGFFITVCTLGITFYYSVVTAWSLQYLGFSVQNLYQNLAGGNILADDLAQDPGFLQLHWDSIANQNYLTIALHIFAVGLGILVLQKNIQDGFEKANRVLIPTLFVLLILISGMAINSKNGIKGLEYMFKVDWGLFKNATVWIEALSQSAWSTGAGWGLIMTIASYAREKEDVTLNTFIGGFGNNTASLISGMAILPAVFAMAKSDADAIEFLQSGNQALTFIIIPELFTKIPGGYLLSVIFFLAFFLAAFSSLLPMLELFIKMISEVAGRRKKAAYIAGGICVVLGFPSAYSLDFFSNQDWVWGIGLIISGMFIAFAAIYYGPGKFKTDLIDKDSDFKVPTQYFKICILVNLFLGIVLIYWWMSQGYSEYPWFDEKGNWNLFDTYSNATIITQWGTVLVIGLVLNKYLYQKFAK